VNVVLVIGAVARPEHLDASEVAARLHEPPRDRAVAGDFAAVDFVDVQRVAGVVVGAGRVRCPRDGGDEVAVSIPFAESNHGGDELRRDAHAGTGRVVVAARFCAVSSRRIANTGEGIRTVRTAEGGVVELDLLGPVVAQDP